MSDPVLKASPWVFLVYRNREIQTLTPDLFRRGARRRVCLGRPERAHSIGRLEPESADLDRATGRAVWTG